MTSDDKIVKAKCIYNKNWNHKLIVGKVYDIEYINANRWVSFMGEDGQLWWTPADWFEIAEEQ